MEPLIWEFDSVLHIFCVAEVSWDFAVLWYCFCSFFFPLLEDAKCIFFGRLFLSILIFCLKSFSLKLTFQQSVRMCCMCLLQRRGKLVNADFYEKLFMLGMGSKLRRGWDQDWMHSQSSPIAWSLSLVEESRVSIEKSYRESKTKKSEKIMGKSSL